MSTKKAILIAVLAWGVVGYFLSPRDVVAWVKPKSA